MNGWTPRRATGLGSTLLVLLLSPAARADVVASPLATPPLVWLVAAGSFAFLLLLVGSFVFIVKPPRKP